MAELFKIGAGVATPLGLLGLVVVAALFAYWRHLKHKTQQFKDLPEEQRARAADERLSRYNLDAANLTREHKYQLIQREMDQKADRFRRALVVGAVVVVILFIIGALCYLFGPRPPEPSAAPKQFSFDTYDTCYDPRLPEDIFGAIDGPARTRRWMAITEQGACAELQVVREGARLFWLLTEPYRHGLAGCHAHVNVGTREDAVVLVFLVLTDEVLKLTPAPYAGVQGPTAEYAFDVPESRSPARILVFLAMKSDAYDRIKREPKFHLRSRPLPTT